MIEAQTPTPQTLSFTSSHEHMEACSPQPPPAGLHADEKLALEGLGSDQAG